MQLLEESMTKQNYTRDLGKRIDKTDPEYGKPQKGTWTAMRGEKAQSHVHRVSRQILHFCVIIAIILSGNSRFYKRCNFPA